MSGAATGRCGGRGRVGGGVGRRRRRGSQEQAERGGRRPGHRSAEEVGQHLQGPLPVPRREDAVVLRHPGPRELEVLRLRAGRRHLQLRHAARQRVVPRGAQGPGRPRRRRARRADEPRRRPAQAPAPRGPRRGDRLLPHRPDQPSVGAAGARLPARPRLHATRRSRRSSSAGRPAAGRRRASSSSTKRGATAEELADGRPDHPARHGPGRRLRPLPRADHLPDPRRDRERDRARRPLPRRRGRHPRPRPEVPQLARPRRCSTRAGRSTSSTRPRARSASPARR